MNRRSLIPLLLIAILAVVALAPTLAPTPASGSAVPASGGGPGIADQVGETSSSGGGWALLGLGGALAIGLAMAGPQVRDALVKTTVELPDAAETNTSTAIDTGKATTSGEQPGNVEFLVSAPALTTTQLPDTKTITYNIIHSDNADLSSSSALLSAVITQTGAGGAGAAAATFRFKLPSTAKRYIGLTAVGVATVDADDADGTLEALF